MYFSEPPKYAPGSPKERFPSPIYKNMPVGIEVAQNYKKNRLPT